MRIVLKAMVLLAACVPFLTPYPLAAQAPYTLSISAESPAVKSGDHVAIRVTVTNTSKHEIEFPVRYNYMLTMDSLDKYEIVDGAAVPAIKNTLKHPELASQSLDPPTIIKPGESKVVGTDFLNVAYNLTRPGEYTVQLSRQFSHRGKEEVVRSNKIIVTVTP